MTKERQEDFGPSKESRSSRALLIVPCAKVQLNFDQLLRNNSTRRLMARYPTLKQFVQYLENTYIRANPTFPVPFLSTITHVDHGTALPTVSMELWQKTKCKPTQNDVGRTVPPGAQGLCPRRGRPWNTWKLDMVSFWNKRHFKYFIIGHQMLTGVGGFLPARLQHDLTWNRVVNLRGGPGGNIGLDLINEFLNNDFKDVPRWFKCDTPSRAFEFGKQRGGFYPCTCQVDMRGIPDFWQCNHSAIEQLREGLKLLDLLSVLESEPHLAGSLLRRMKLTYGRSTRVLVGKLCFQSGGNKGWREAMSAYSMDSEAAALKEYRVRHMQHQDYTDLTKRVVLEQVGPLLRDKKGRLYRRRLARILIKDWIAQGPPYRGPLLKIIGQAVAVSIANRGATFPFLSPPVFAYMTQAEPQQETWPAEALLPRFLPDGNVRRIVEEQPASWRRPEEEELHKSYVTADGCTKDALLRELQKISKGYLANNNARVCDQVLGKIRVERPAFVPGFRRSLQFPRSCRRNPRQKPKVVVAKWVADLESRVVDARLRQDAISAIIAKCRHIRKET
ncbi:hypothetical protein Bbelb_049740 [Branchiostoma belcheri]|nr:hypothetical protein Bbelb_049740 [Branchiostoma belcheri]